ncbi:hypothetical protein [Pseudomonas monteilii]|uniref:hypothetical protein n=1 Tax=Pseudomonas monteilii TaxID=76759 RepID=UPI001E369037|nr:hypothetical protein [Pseudomonas monteilii]MCE0872554.1 hypothetical protein [Pseudomonas monteilii]
MSLTTSAGMSSAWLDLAREAAMNRHLGVPFLGTIRPSAQPPTGSRKAGTCAAMATLCGKKGLSPGWVKGLWRQVADGLRAQPQYRRASCHGTKRASRSGEIGSNKLLVSSVEKRVARSRSTQPASFDQKPQRFPMAVTLGEYTTRQ